MRYKSQNRAFLVGSYTEPRIIDNMPPSYQAATAVGEVRGTLNGNIRSSLRLRTVQGCFGLLPLQIYLRQKSQ